MNADDRPPEANDEMIEELVAYLDGELDADASREVERRLSQDAQYRQKLRQLQRSWDLLDVLSRAEPDQELTRTTIAMVARNAHESPPDRQQTSLAVRDRLPWHWLAVAAAVLVGFVAISLPVRAKQNRGLRDLPIARNSTPSAYR